MHILQYNLNIYYSLSIFSCRLSPYRKLETVGAYAPTVRPRVSQAMLSSCLGEEIYAEYGCRPLNRRYQRLAAAETFSRSHAATKSFSRHEKFLAIDSHENCKSTT